MLFEITRTSMYSSEKLPYDKASKIKLTDCIEIYDDWRE